MTLNSRDNRQLVFIELNASEHSPHCTHTHTHTQKNYYRLNYCYQ